jgi:hypothetical protein
VKGIVGGKDAWKRNLTIQRAIEIEEGVIKNPKILTFQKRTNNYPHPISG